MNYFIHLLLFTSVAAVLFASSDPTVAAAPAGDDKDIPDKLRIDNPFGGGLLRGIGSGIKSILSSVAVGLGGEKALPKSSKGDDDMDIPDTLRSDKNNPFGEGLLRGIGSGVKSILSSVAVGLGGEKAPTGEKALPKPLKDDDDKDVSDTLRFDKNNPFGQGLLRDIGSGVKNILSGVSDGLGGTKPSKTYFYSEKK